MGAQQVELTGQITVGGSACADSCVGGSLKQQSLSLRCSGQWYPAVVSTDVPVQIQTAGAVGAAWVEAPTTDALDKIELLMLRGNAPMRVRVGAAVARLLSTAVVFPVTFVAETLIFMVDGGAAITCTFTAGVKTAQQIVNALNAAAALAGGLAVLPWSVDTSGQIALSGVATGVQGAVAVTGGTAQAMLGFAVTSTAVGAGADTDFVGLYLVEYGRGSILAPSRVQVSGIGQLEVFAAGTTA
jgi:hypothetical protein